MMNSIEHMVLDLQSKIEIENKMYSTPKIILNIDPIQDDVKITKEEWAILQKDFLFEKLKGKSLADFFIDRIKPSDYIFTLSVSDEFTSSYIETHYLK